MQNLFLLLALLTSAALQLTAQRSFTVAPNDGTNTRLFVLDNGLRVYISPLRDQPRVHTLLHVRVGSKNDPADATGLSHYLEHMLFKGTDSLGTIDYRQERVLVDTIEQLFEIYRETTDSTQRAALYHSIDSLSTLAAQFAVPNEYDRVMAALGVTGSNAFTTEDATVYIGDVPSNRLPMFLEVEAERFRNPVLRLFHTELEAVYEEKNMSLDSDSDLAYDTLMRSVFPKHPYGTQSTLGTIEHLKNPSMVAIRRHFDTYYIPNNMALILVGDVDYDSALAMVEATLGRLRAGEPPPHAAPSALVELNNRPIIEKSVVGPEAESVTIAFQLPPARFRDIPALIMADALLSNSVTGLIDINLKQTQRVLDASAYINLMTDHSVHILEGKPSPGQTLEEVRDLLLEQIEILRTGPINVDDMQAIVRNRRKQELQAKTSRHGRAYSILQPHLIGVPWPRYVNLTNELSTINEAQIRDVVDRYYDSNYVVVFKRSGARGIDQSITKPAITPLELGADTSSVFAQRILSIPATPVAPVFSDWSKDFEQGALNRGANYVLARKPGDSLVRLGFSIPVGYRHERALRHAFAYAQFVGTEQRSAAELARARYGVALDVQTSVSANETWIELSCLRSTLDEALTIVAEQFGQCVVDTAAWSRYVENVVQERSDARNNPDQLFAALRAYARFGDDSPARTDLTSDELRALDPNSLVAYVRSIFSTKHTVYAYGDVRVEDILRSTARLYTGVAFRSAPLRRPLRPRMIKEQEVLVLNHDMVQAQVGMTGVVADRMTLADEGQVALVNAYLNGGMGSIIFQRLREAKALAYSASGNISGQMDSAAVRFVGAFIGTQADKLIDAIDGMREIFSVFPAVPSAFESGKANVVSEYETERIVGWDALITYKWLRLLGHGENTAPTLYSAAKATTFDTMRKAYERYVRGRLRSMFIVGSIDKLDMAALRKYGAVRTITADDVLPR
jgi:predicted Zn-dependent peptidase